MTSGAPPAVPKAPAGSQGRVGARPAAAVFGVVLGLLPHLAHHIGWFAGAALIAGAGGTVLFAVVGLALMAPMLLRLHRRFSWKGPAVALAAYAVMFTLSTTVIGPALRSMMEDPAPQAPTVTDHTPPPGGGHGHRPG